jgi:hypothetical protein
VNEPTLNISRENLLIPSAPKSFVEAEQLLSAAMHCIQEGRSESPSSTGKVCVLILELLEGVRLPLRRLGRNYEPRQVAGGAS